MHKPIQTGQHSIICLLCKLIHKRVCDCKNSLNPINHSYIHGLPSSSRIDTSAIAGATLTQATCIERDREAVNCSVGSNMLSLMLVTGTSTALTLCWE